WTRHTSVLIFLQTSAVLQRGYCGPGWESFNGRCYMFFPFPKSWADSEVHCVSLGGSLASVHNSYANHFITNLIKSQDSTGPPTCWLGLTNGRIAGVLQTSSWLWTDGSPWDFTKWHWGEPNNFGGTENCIHINYTFNWNSMEKKQKVFSQRGAREVMCLDFQKAFHKRTCRST
uniref:C-type lectin domain-containing protein n=1 Tax=Erpetoichthys calabaricus TaxID=27687 RepID=A0A8C4T477_ERPCA